MHLMIFDPHNRGHYFAYIRYMLRGAACAQRVTLVLEKGISKTEPFQQQLLSCVNDVEVKPEIRPGVFNKGKQLLEEFSAACSRHKPDHIWVPSGDLLAKYCNLAYILKRWRFPAGIEGECGIIEIRFHRPPRRWRGHLRHIFDRTLLSVGPWTRLHTIDPTVFTWVQARGGRLAKRLELMPEPVDDFTPISKEYARRSLDIPTNGRYVGSVGAAHALPRKGSDLLLEAFARAKLVSTDRLLLAGPLGDKLRYRIETEFAPLYRSGRIVVLDRYLNDSEVMHALSAMDVVCTPYFDHMGSSAIVLRAAQAGCMVLAPHQGWFADMIPRFELGDTGDILEVTALAAALEKTLERSEGFRVSSASQRLIEYSNARNFARLWAVRIRERMGLPADNEIRTWEWVLQALEGGQESGR
jgi:glycosyltransferase involved in cell wall biosynthesis